MKQFNELKLIESKSGYGWYCKYTLKAEGGATIYLDGQYQDGEIFSQIKSREEAIERFENAIIDFGGMQEDIDNIQHINQSDQYVCRFEKIV